MSEKLGPGEALVRKLRETEKQRAKWAKLSNARKNSLARQGLVLGGDLTAEENLELQRRLKRECMERWAA